jgi:lipoprotein-anchoring transpeptidase ErfK/SrfK
VTTEPPVLETLTGRRRRSPVVGACLAALSSAAVALIAVTSCFGSGYVWTAPLPTPTPTATATLTPTATATATVTPTATTTPLSDQTAKAMVGGQVWHTAYVTTGKAGWETPIGTFQINYRVYDETMTSASIGAEEYYVLTHVLFTQYFTSEGHALHLNYWRPDSVFGTTPTSHGCVGMRYADAEFFWNFATNGTRVVIQP